MTRKNWRATCGFFAGRRPRVMGHRGAAGIRPENTLPSFLQGLADGADILEMDLRLTKDNQVVVWHDPSVDRTTDGTGLVKNLTLSQLERLDCGFRFTPDGRTYPARRQGFRIATFAEVLRTFPHTPLNVEIKDPSMRLADETLRLLDRYGRLDGRGNVLVVARRRPFIRHIRTKAPLILTSHCLVENIRFVTSSRLRLPFFRPFGDAIQLPLYRRGWRIVTPAVVAAAHRVGMEVHVWTVNEETEMRRLLNMGVDGIFTDFPGRLRRLVDDIRGTKANES